MGVHYLGPLIHRFDRNLLTSAEEQTNLSNHSCCRMGYALAIGQFPRFFLEDKLEFVFTNLIEACQITEKESKWADARRDAVKTFSKYVLSKIDSVPARLHQF